MVIMVDVDGYNPNASFSSYFQSDLIKSDTVTTLPWYKNDSVIIVLDGNVNDDYKNVSGFVQPTFNQNALTVIIVYCVLFVIAAIGNLTVFITLFRSRRRKSRISLMISHLAIADLLVTFVMIPLEVGWRITVKWMAGNFACKAFLFLRAFGLYLSSNVLICVSLDRYFAVLHPLRVTDARRRGRMMLACAWGFSLICSFPQSLVFHVSSPPDAPDFEQCVSFGYFQTPAFEIAYNLFCVAAMYFIPLLVISVAYTCILCEISKKSKETQDLTIQSKNSRMHLRRSDIRNIERARSRTLRMTVTIVSVFVWCWMPYTVMTLWYMFDRESAMKVDNRIQDYLFLMAVSNSCMNPLVYGSYAMNFRRECARCCGCLFPKQLDRKSTGALVSSGGLARRIMQCTRTLRKVGSGVTRTTATCNNVHRNINGATTPGQKQVRIQTRPSSVGYTAGIDPDFISCRPSFHSDPNSHSEDYRICNAELNRTLAMQGLLTTRSLDNTMTIGYRRHGHQIRWR